MPVSSTCSKWWSLKLLAKESLNPSYHQSRDCQRLIKTFMGTEHCLINFPSQLQLLFASSMAFTLSMIFCSKDYVLIVETVRVNLFPIGRWRWVSLRKILISSSLFLKAEHNHHSKSLLRYDIIRCQVKIITMDMFSPYYDLARQLFQNAKIVLIAFTLRYYIWTLGERVHWPFY